MPARWNKNQVNNRLFSQEISVTSPPMTQAHAPAHPVVEDEAELAPAANPGRLMPKRHWLITVAEGWGMEVCLATI